MYFLLIEDNQDINGPNMAVRILSLPLLIRVASARRSV